MIYVKDKKAALCKGDFHPAQLYKGDTKIAGYTLTELEGDGSVMLTDCYNDKVYDALIHGKNLLDVQKVYPDYVNDEGGITFSNSVFSKVGSVNMFTHWKENTQYTFSTNYEMTNANNNRVNLLVTYTDGTKKNFWYGMGGLVTGDKSGYGSSTTEAGKTVKRMQLAYSTSSRAMDAKLTNMQLEEGTAATEYEEPCREATVTVEAMENADKMQTVLFENGELTADIPTFKGTTVIEVEADIEATISGKYKKMEV